MFVKLKNLIFNQRFDEFFSNFTTRFNVIFVSNNYSEHIKYLNLQNKTLFRYKKYFYSIIDMFNYYCYCVKIIQII